QRAREERRTAVCDRHDSLLANRRKQAGALGGELKVTEFLEDLGISTRDGGHPIGVALLVIEQRNAEVTRQHCAHDIVQTREDLLWIEGRRQRLRGAQQGTGRRRLFFEKQVRLVQRLRGRRQLDVLLREVP